MKYRSLSFIFIVYFCIFLNAHALENDQGKCKASESTSLKLMVVFNPNGEGDGWNSSSAGISATTSLKNLLRSLSTRLPIVFKCNGIHARFPSVDSEKKDALESDEYVLNIKPASAYYNSRVGSTITLSVDLLSPSPRKMAWHSQYTLGPVSAFSILMSADEKANIQADQLSNFLLIAFRNNKIGDPENPLVDFYGEKIKFKAQMNDSGYADLNNVDAIPYLNERGRSEYGSYTTKKLPRAFAIAPNGSFGWSSGYPNAQERALDNCNKNGKGECRLYSVDEKVVWVNEK